MMERCLIVAAASNGAIGKDNQLLWHISEDLKFLKSSTMGCPVIMGRRTFESIGRALPGRLNIVVSRTMTEAPAKIVVAGSLEDAYRIAEESGAERCFLMGGGQLYAAGLDCTDRLYLTKVMVEIPEADTFFPEVDWSEWTVEYESEVKKDPETGYDFQFVVYKKNLSKETCRKEKDSAADSEL
ncbi:MAG: dihydrofolate reductase [Bacteroidales bacterium]|nr:dihydrofolate reductase [Candidatus Cryptobacteroides caccocaballi]